MKRIKLLYLVLVVGIIIVSGEFPALAATETPTILIDGRPFASEHPLIWDDGTILISIEDISSCINAGFQWNEPGESSWIQKSGNTLLFRISSNQVLKNSHPIVPPVSPRFIDRVFYVPFKFVAENLGATLIWDQNEFQIKVTSGERHEPVERIDDQTFDAIVAYTDKGNLWLLDGRKPDALPKQITDSGHAELVGWSQDGKWLAYTYANDNRGMRNFLWVVDAEGNINRPIDAQPILDEPAWSPTENRLAYTTWKSSTDGYIPEGTVKSACIDDKGIQINSLIEENIGLISSLAWHPTGKSLAVSISRTRENPPTIEQVDLDGKRKILYSTKDQEIVDFEGMYDAALISLKWSPDGNQIAYHMRMNSASLTADVVATGILNIDTGQTIELKEGLKYPQWLTFSPDGRELAYIAGTGRDVLNNKQLNLVDLTNGLNIDYSSRGYIDAQPVWLSEEYNELLFCRGRERDIVADSDIFPGVMIPGQRIYKLGKDGKAAVLTTGHEDTADYYPSPSLDGKKMIFIRLEHANQGSLYIQTTKTTGKEIEIMRGIRGDLGYYGSYYPQWIQVHWFK